MTDETDKRRDRLAAAIEALGLEWRYERECVLHPDLRWRRVRLRAAHEGATEHDGCDDSPAR